MRRPIRVWPSCAAAILLAACQTVPYTGRSHLMLISAREEKQLGEQAYKETLQKAKVSTDTAKVALLRRVGHRLSKAADKPDFQWEFNLVEDEKMINAWCLPGGKVAFYTGILPVTQDETGAAVVMGHEIAHALARHGGERMSQGLLANLGGQVLSVFIAKQPDKAREVFGQAYGLGVGVGVMLPFSRHQESEADHIGLILMAKAGYDPEAALAFWERMEKAAEGKGGRPPEFLSTHPAGETRRQQIRRWLPEARQYLKAVP